jgi:hypothetical protein
MKISRESRSFVFDEGKERTKDERVCCASFVRISMMLDE